MIDPAKYVEEVLPCNFACEHRSDWPIEAHVPLCPAFNRPAVEKAMRRYAAAVLANDMPSPARLELLALWVDVKYPEDDKPEVQTDLRKWAHNIRALAAQLLGA